jgi:hypothetical protein
MACQNDELVIRRGHNRWVLARTDRDAPTLDDVQNTTGAFLRTVLGPASPFGQRGVSDGLSVPGSAGKRFFIGAARPIDIQAVQPESTSEALALVRPEGELLGSHTDCAVIRTVQAERPWIVAANFDWRAPTTTIPWPKRKVSDLGFELLDDQDHGLDWLLLGASHAGLAKHPDSTLVDETGKAVAKGARELLSSTRTLIMLGVVGAGGYYLVRRGLRARRRMQARARA